MIFASFEFDLFQIIRGCNRSYQTGNFSSVDDTKFVYKFKAVSLLSYLALVGKSLPYIGVRIYMK